MMRCGLFFRDPPPSCPPPICVPDFVICGEGGSFWFVFGCFWGGIADPPPPFVRSFVSALGLSLPKCLLASGPPLLPLFRG